MSVLEEKNGDLSSKNALSGIDARTVSIRKVDQLNGTTDVIATELAVAMVYNGISHAVMMATPENLEDFALGFSLTEGLIDSPDDIRSIDVCLHEHGVELNMGISTACFEDLKHTRRQLSGRTGCGLCGVESLEAAAPIIKSVPVRSLPGYDSVHNAIQTLDSRQPLKAQCGAVHAAALVSCDGTILHVREDVGRHNALDKLIGALAKTERSDDDFILISSRASFEMVAKVASQGYSNLVAVSAPTSLAIDLAKQAGMNLIGFVRDERQVIYTEYNGGTE